MMRLVKFKTLLMNLAKKLAEESTKKSLIEDTEKWNKMVKQLCV